MTLKKNMLWLCLLSICLLPATLFAQTPVAHDSSAAFALHDGDRVTFYGDSITEQREYTEDIEEYVLTRFPQWKVSFHNAGVGGDKVSGGWAGPIDLRLTRDVYAWNPTVITIMLGMNDGYYRQSQPGIFSTYTAGYEHIVDSMQKHLPEARITLIQPSPFDDVTRAEQYPGGYNGVMLKDSAFLAQLSHEKNTGLADFNTPVTNFLKVLNAKNPALAQQLIPDRVHPQQGGHWLMAESLLESWHAPAMVSSVTMDAKTRKATAQNASVSNVRKSRGGLEWTETESALPLPLTPSALDPVLGLAVQYSDLVNTLDQETLQVQGLPAGQYDLKIDGRKVATLSGQELNTGINLATLDTPMLAQARLVRMDTQERNVLEAARFTIINSSETAESSPTAAALAQAMPAAEARQRADAQPVAHHFELQLHHGSI